MTHRISWIDICKGIGILSVLYAHALDANSVRYLFYSFHIPLFFFLSGVVFHHRNNENFFRSLRKSVNGILKPYLFFSLISIIIWYILRGFPVLNTNFFLQQIIHITYGNGSSNQFFYNVVLWFLPCLFASRMLFTLIITITQKRVILFLMLLVCAIGGYILSTFFPHLKLPFGLETALSAVVFFGIGYIWHSHHGLMKRIIHEKAGRIFILSLIFSVLSAVLNYSLTGRQIDMRLNFIENIFLFYMTAFLGITCCVSLSHIFEKNKVLEYLGKNSMQLFIWHLAIFSVLSKLLLVFMTPEVLGNLRNIYLAPLYTVVSTLIILMVYKIILYTKGAFSKS